MQLQNSGISVLSLEPSLHEKPHHYDYPLQFLCSGVLTWASPASFSAFSHLWEGHNLMSLSEMGFSSLHQLPNLFLPLRVHGAIWGLICLDVKGLGGWEAVGTGYPFPDLDQSVCEQQGLGLPAPDSCTLDCSKKNDRAGEGQGRKFMQHGRVISWGNWVE